MNRCVASLAAVGIAGFALAGSANATVVFSDNFNSYNGGVGVTNFANFAPNWTVSDGTVDLIGNGFFDFLPGNGLYVDMDGSTRNAGTLTSRDIFLAAGTYVLQFDLAGNRRDGIEESVNVQVQMGDLFNETFSLPQNAPFTTYTREFTVTTAGNFRLIFAGAGGDNIGMLLDDVSVYVPEPASLALLGLGLLGAGVFRGRRGASK